MLSLRKLSSIMLLGFEFGLSCMTDSSPTLKLLVLHLSWTLGLSLDNLFTN